MDQFYAALWTYFAPPLTAAAGSTGRFNGGLLRRRSQRSSRRPTSRACRPARSTTWCRPWASGISKSQVSRLCGEIDDRIQSFLDRPLEGDWPYLWLDATYLKVRQAGRIASALPCESTCRLPEPSPAFPFLFLDILRQYKGLIGTAVPVRWFPSRHLNELPERRQQAWNTWSFGRQSNIQASSPTPISSVPRKSRGGPC